MAASLRLLFVGRRQGALAAAARLRAQVYVLDDAPASPALTRRVRAFAQVDLDDSAEVISAARKLFAKTRPPDAVVALVERAVLPAAVIREALGVRGARPAQALLWRDKLAMKARVREAGIACTDVLRVDASTDPEALVAALGLPLVLKPRSASGGRGTLVLHDVQKVRTALAAGEPAESSTRLAERFVDGGELSVESIVQGGEIVFENVTEYLSPGWSNIVPAQLSASIEGRVRALNRAAIAALEIQDGIAHLEAFVTAQGEIVFGEVACRPPGGALMELIEDVYGFDPWTAHLAVELRRPIAPAREAASSAGVCFLHPGEGQVLALRGVDDARRVPGIVRVECPLIPGQLVRRREGIGQHTGRIVARTRSRDHTARALEAARALVQIELAPAIREGQALAPEGA
jgi:biotin carboxylase